MEQTLPASTIQRWLQLAAHRGHVVEEVLAAAGIGSHILHAEQGLGRVTFWQFQRLIRVVTALEGDELVNQGDQAVPIGSCDALARLTMHATDLREVIARAQRFLPVFPGLPAMGAAVQGTTVRIELDTRHLDDPMHILTEASLALAHRFAGWLIGRRIELTSLELMGEAPPYQLDFERTFRTRPSYGHLHAGLEFDSTLLDQPVVRTEQDWDALLAGSREELLALIDYGRSTADQTRIVLSGSSRGYRLRTEDVAARLSMSPTHLRRRLRAEGTAFTEIREQILRDRAIASLTQTDETITEISRSLGFSEDSAFRRAFRRWTGSPPGAYRRGCGDV